MKRRRRVVQPKTVVFQRCESHPLGALEVIIPFRDECAVFCRSCRQEVVSGVTQCLAFLLREVQGARVKLVEIADGVSADDGLVIDAERCGFLYRIGELPTRGDLGLDDMVIVERRPPTNELWAAKVVQRRHGMRSTVRVKRDEDLETLRQFFEPRGWAFRATDEACTAVLAHSIGGEKPQAVVRSSGVKGAQIKTRRVGPEGKVG